MPPAMHWNLANARTAACPAFFVAALGLVTVLGVAVRTCHLAHPMRYDESYNYLHYVSRGPWHIITQYVPNNHILHTLSVWAVGRVVGHSPAGLRIPAFLAGILLIPATSWLAWVFSRRMSVALLSGLGVCCSSPLIEYSVNARGYSMLTLFAVLACLALHYALQRPPQLWRWICWGAISATGMYTVPIMALPVLGMAIASVLIAIASPEKDRRNPIVRGLAWSLVTCLFLGMLAYLPVLITGGLESFTKSQELAYEILGRQISSPIQMAFATLALWTRLASLLLVIIVLA
jgi:4-amino-4-deoxy-L-arabinose transferase-like glycosyltransferase